MDNVTIRYLGPFRELKDVPKKVDKVYDEGIGRDKLVTAHWVKLINGDIVAEGIPLAMAQKIDNSSNLFEIVSGGKITVENKSGKGSVYQDFDESRLVKVDLTTTTEVDVLKEQNASQVKQIEDLQRENARLRDFAREDGETHNQSNIPTEVKQEKDALTPKKKVAA